MADEVNATTSGDAASYFKIVGGRKFFLSILVSVVNAYLVYTGKISDGVYSTVVVAVIATYIAGDVYENTSVKVK